MLVSTITVHLRLKTIAGFFVLQFENKILFSCVSVNREVDGDGRGYRSAEEQARELTRSIRREVSKLSEQWNALIDRSDLWQRRLADTINVSLSHLCFNPHYYHSNANTRADDRRQGNTFAAA
jgi:hypothetical protein